MLWFLPCLDTSSFQSSQLVAVSIWIWSISKTLVYESLQSLLLFQQLLNHVWERPSCHFFSFNFPLLPCVSLSLSHSLSPPRLLQRHELVLLKVTHSPSLAPWTRLRWESQKYVICQAMGFTATILCSSPACASFSKYYKNQKNYSRNSTWTLQLVLAHSQNQRFGIGNSLCN